MNRDQEAELERVKFVTERDGEVAAQMWALRTMRMYRHAVLQNGKNGKKFHFASSRDYKAKFINSYLVLKRVALNNKRGIDIER